MKDLINKYNELLKDNLLVRFRQTPSDNTAIITLENYSFSGRGSESCKTFTTKSLPDFTMNAIISNCTNNKYVYYICPLSYKETIINNSSIAEVVITTKFKNNTLNEMYKEINDDTRKI